MKKYLLMIVMAFWSLQLKAAPTFGRYLGVLQHEHLPQDQLARLDFITEQESGGILKLRATLVLYFGDYNSDEYASYDYDNVTYNLLTGTLIFDSSEREVHFVVNDFSGGRFDANLKTGHGVVGRLLLSQDSQVKVERPLVQKIWGEYRGVCGGVGQRLQVQSTPSHPIATNRTDPFAPFIIMAQIGDNAGAGCPIGASTCVTNVYHDADYDIFTGHVDFHGAYGSFSCNVDESGMTCGECRYNRSSSEGVRSGVVALPLSQPKWTMKLNENASTAGLQGVYKGYVHLERRDIYQAMSIAVTTYRQGSGGTDSNENLMVSIVSSIRFGGHTDTDEAINTKFDPRPLNIMNTQPVFDRTDHSTDMILKITKIGGGIVEGAWYSRRFGLVGNFYLTSSGLVELAEPEKLDSKLTGHFSDGKLNVDMVVAMSDRATSSKDSFSPLTIQGNLWYTDITARNPFTDTAFDPFTGKFALETNGPGGAYIGQRTKRGIKLKVPNLGILRPMQSHNTIELMEVSR
jgi:hypothetical protein